MSLLGATDGGQQVTKNSNYICVLVKGSKFPSCFIYNVGLQRTANRSYR